MDKSGAPQFVDNQPPPSYDQGVTVMTVPIGAQVAMNNITAVGPKPAQIVCSSCNATIVTRVDHKSTTKTHIIALLLCVFCCWPCVCIPYCTDSCMNADHYCPNCNSYLGTYAH